MLRDGFSCENTFINYTPSVTACGHASIYTGSVPAIHGITGNLWIDRISGKTVYCSEDENVKTVGSPSEAGFMSPRNLLTTTICDELRLATNFRSKVIGIAIKDRGSILTTGHSANAAYWYDPSAGNWITSTYYMADLPKWVKDFNAQKWPDKYYARDWNTLFPLNTYVQSTADAKSYEAKSLGGGGFPYNLKQYIGKNYNAINATPYGNTFTVEMAKAAVNAEFLGANDTTDFLAVSFSSPDYIGHSFGPNSIEEEDGFLRLDKDLGDLLDFLDVKVGKNQYLVFLSADHGAAHIPGFLKEHRIPAGNTGGRTMADLNGFLRTRFGRENLISGFMNYQLHLNTARMDSFGINRDEVKKAVMQYAAKQPGIARVVDLEAVRQSSLNATVQEMLINNYMPNRCGDVQLIFEPQWLDGFESGGTTHGLWNPYDTHIPLLWYGWGVKPGKTNRTVHISDIAPTLAALLQIQMPNGSVGNVIEEVKR